MFRPDHGRFPTSKERLIALVTTPRGDARKNTRRTTKSDLLDPWGNPYSYEYPPTRQEEFPDISSAGADMIFGTEFDIGNWDRDRPAQAGGGGGNETGSTASALATRNPSQSPPFIRRAPVLRVTLNALRADWKNASTKPAVPIAIPSLK